MVKSSEFHREIPKRGKKRGWHLKDGEGKGSYLIYEDKDGIRWSLIMELKRWAKDCEKR